MDLTMKRCGCGALWRPVGRASKCAACLRVEAERLMKERAGETAPPVVSQFDPQASGRPSTPKPSGYVWEDVGGTTRNHPTGRKWPRATQVCVITSGPSKAEVATLLEWRELWKVLVGRCTVAHGYCISSALARKSAEDRFETYLATGK